MEKKRKRIPVRNSRRFCALLLSLVLCIGMLPSTVLAADEQTDDMQVDTYAVSVSSEEETTYYETVKDAFTYANNLSSAATITLFTDCKVSAALTIAEGADITLDLSGHTISANGSARVLDVYGSLTLTDGSSEGEGMITGGGGVSYGGGAYVYAGGCLTMKGGSIAGNRAAYGGGFYVRGSVSLEGGSITGNTATSGGGGIYLYSKSTCSISGGEVSNNQTSGSGGGIYVSRAALTMSGGQVTGNIANTSGGGVYVTGTYTFNLQDSPVVIGNLSGTSDNDIYLPAGKLLKLTGALTDSAEIGVKTASVLIGEDDLIQITDTENGTAYYQNAARYFVSDDGYGVRANKNGYLALYLTEDEDTYVASVMDGEGNTIRYQSAASALTYACTLEKSTVTLLADGSFGTSLTVDKEKRMTLDLNGNELTYTGNSWLLQIYGTLTLQDESIDKRGKLTATADKSLYNGAVKVLDGGVFYLESGAIIGHQTTYRSACGGGVNVQSGGLFVMSGGEIAECSVAMQGGGVYVGGTFTMSGGKIDGNSAAYGGGVYLASGGTMNISGSPVITGNKNAKTGADENVYLPSSRKPLTLTGTLTSGAEIGVTTSIALSGNTEVAITGTETDTDYYKTAVQYFSSDKGGYAWTGADGYIYLASYAVRLTNVQDSGYNAGVTAKAVGAELNHAMTGEYSYQWYRNDSNGYSGAALIEGETEASYIPSTDAIETYYCYCALTSVDEDGTQTQYYSNIDKIIVFTEKAASVDDGKTLTYYPSVGSAFNYANSISDPCTITLLWDSQTDETLTVGSGRVITLDLAGHTLSTASYISVLTVNGTLTLADSSENDEGLITGGKGTPVISGSYYNSGSGGGVYVGTSGTFYMTGGTISGNKAYYEGGGVYVGTSGTFVMSGGVISGNEADSSTSIEHAGGGVYVNGGTFEMTGGSIEENMASTYGGGAYISNGTFTMNGGEISKNMSDTCGGGIYLSGGAYTLSDGVISENDGGTYGGGAYISDGAFTMSGGEISKNMASAYGGGIYLSGGEFVLDDGVISENDGGISGGGIYLAQETLYINGGTITENAADVSGGGIYVGSSSTVEMSGVPFLAGNTVDGFSNNLYLPSGKRIFLSGTLENGASVGVTTEKTPTENSDVMVTELSAKYAPSSAMYFFSDAGYDVRTTDTGYVVLWLDTSPKDAKTPAFTAQPQSAAYIVGDEAVALDVEANVSDSGTLTYQWYVCSSDSDTDGEAIDGADRQSYTPSTDTEGTFYYYCIVTNTNNSVDGQQQVSAASEIAVITVTAASGGEDDEDNGDGENGGNNGDEETGGDSGDEGTGGDGGNEDDKNTDDDNAGDGTDEADPSYSGFALSGGNWYYFAEGSISTAGYKNSGIDVVKGTIDGSSGWYYVKNGRYVSDYTGFATNANGSWYIENGKVTFKQNSVIKDTTGALSKGTWYYVVGSKVQTSYTGVANYKNANGWWYIKNGKVDFTANTVAKNKNGWWYVVGGKVQLTYTGVANYKNASGWWYIKNGKVDFTANTVAKNKNGWWYVVGGKVQFTYTGVANYKNASGWWYIRNGKVDFTYTGKASNKYGTWKVVKGKVVF